LGAFIHWTHFQTLCFVKYVAFWSVLSNIHINNILCNLELFQYNVFIFLFRKNTQHILINVAMYNYVVWKWVQWMNAPNMLRYSTTTYSIKVTNIDIYFLYQIRHVQQRYEGLSVVNIPLILFTIHVYVYFMLLKYNLCKILITFNQYQNMDKT
jgi:hypothetical protein